MTRSDQEDRERAARRARRLAERAEQRAQRKAAQARRAAERAELLAERARRGDTPRGDAPRSSARRGAARETDATFEEYVDRLTEKWEKKAGAWIDEKSRELFSDDGSDYDMGDDGMGETVDADVRSAEQEARRARTEADRARRRAEEAETRSAASGRMSSRRQRRRARRSRRFRTIRSRFNSGRGLYRDKDQGKVCGVCAGLADYLDVDTWKVRLFAVLGLVFVPTVAVPVYFITYWMMDDKPYYRRMTDSAEPSLPEEEDDDMDEDDYQDQAKTSAADKNARRRRTSQKTPEMSNAEAFLAAKNKFGDLEQRLRGMESYVTSSQFELQRELRKISGDES